MFDFKHESNVLINFILSDGFDSEKQVSNLYSDRIFYLF
jgi:hypothetical protein